MLRPDLTDESMCCVNYRRDYKVIRLIYLAALLFHTTLCCASILRAPRWVHQCKGLLLELLGIKSLMELCVHYKLKLRFR